ncbi:hypothetical protein ACG7TL_002411 [Trametes sanguinea]
MALHASVWPGVLAALARHHIADYSIHYHAPLRLLVATFKYTGSDYDADMRGIAAVPETQRWWKVTDGMQESFVEGATGSGGEVPWWQVGLIGHAWIALLMFMNMCSTYRSFQRCSASKEGRRRATLLSPSGIASLALA